VRYNPVTQADGVSVTVSGQLGEGCNSQTYLSLLDHPTYTAGAVRAIWNELGGSIQGSDRIENAQERPPAGPRLLAGPGESSATSTNTATTPWPSSCS
jgi:D-alanyl-D-alanine carboxypeptidase/D-alanyl-D-alanine-endopeptidase (penicillin-binding protein 4)